jgi:hypothetical protein
MQVLQGIVKKHISKHLADRFKGLFLQRFSKEAHY